jgi:hypothetical protein
MWVRVGEKMMAPSSERAIDVVDNQKKSVMQCEVQRGQHQRNRTQQLNEHMQ